MRPRRDRARRAVPEAARRMAQDAGLAEGGTRQRLQPRGCCPRSNAAQHRGPPARTPRKLARSRKSRRNERGTSVFVAKCTGKLQNAALRQRRCRSS
jgi:hypothetical protein